MLGRDLPTTAWDPLPNICSIWSPTGSPSGSLMHCGNVTQLTAPSGIPELTESPLPCWWWSPPRPSGSPCRSHPSGSTSAAWTGWCRYTVIPYHIAPGPGPLATVPAWWWHWWSLTTRARIRKRLRSPGIGSKESIPPACVARQAGTTNRVIVLAHQAACWWIFSL